MSDQYGVHLMCQDESVVSTLRHELSAQFEAMEDQVSIVNHGMSRKQGQGFIELTWLGEIDPEFLGEMECDPRVLDVCVYSIPMMSDEQFRLLETL